MGQTDDYQKPFDDPNSEERGYRYGGEAPTAEDLAEEAAAYGRTLSEEDKELLRRAIEEDIG